MAVDSIALLAPGALPDEERRQSGRRTESFADLLHRLSHQSVVKHFDAYADVAWDSPEFRVDPEDARWEWDTDDALGATAWYRAQPAAIRARIGLHMIATFMKIGVQFEAVLKRGLLAYASSLPDGAPEFRYVYHEVIEEAQHSLMFQEFVNRTGLEVPGLGRFERAMSRLVVGLAPRFPELFFVFVLGGEDPIDHVQRRAMRNRNGLHPLLRRIMQIHVTEEARHLCFAREYLRDRVPRLGRAHRLRLTIGAPIVLSRMARLMMQPSRHIIRTYGIPQNVVAEAYTNNPRHRARTIEALGKVRTLCEELGIVTPASARLWSALGIWDATAA